MKVLSNKRSENKNHILNIATAVQINKELTPPLFSLIRSDVWTLNTCLFSCEVWKQLNFKSVEEDNTDGYFNNGK